MIIHEPCSITEYYNKNIIILNTRACCYDNGTFGLGGYTFYSYFFSTTGYGFGYTFLAPNNLFILFVWNNNIKTLSKYKILYLKICNKNLLSKFILIWY
jgi:hypothetical protein